MAEAASYVPAALHNVAVAVYAAEVVSGGQSHQLGGVSPAYVFALCSSLEWDYAASATVVVMIAIRCHCRDVHRAAVALCTCGCVCIGVCGGRVFICSDVSVMGSPVEDIFVSYIVQLVHPQFYPVVCHRAGALGMIHRAVGYSYEYVLAVCNFSLEWECVVEVAAGEMVLLQRPLSRDVPVVAVGGNGKFVCYGSE